MTSKDKQNWGREFQGFEVATENAQEPKKVLVWWGTAITDAAFTHHIINNWAISHDWSGQAR